MEKGILKKRIVTTLRTMAYGGFALGIVYVSVAAGRTIDFEKQKENYLDEIGCDQRIEETIEDLKSQADAHAISVDDCIQEIDKMKADKEYFIENYGTEAEKEKLADFEEDSLCASMIYGSRAFDSMLVSALGLTGLGVNQIIKSYKGQNDNKNENVYTLGE